MNLKTAAFCLAMAVASFVASAESPPVPSQKYAPGVEAKQVEALSRQKWRWMAERDSAALAKLIHPQATFAHMSRTLSKTEELEVIQTGNIQYKQADVESLAVAVIGDTAIVLSNIQLFAIVRGNEARNPFTVTETFVRRDGEWQLAALAFTRRVTPDAK